MLHRLNPVRLKFIREAVDAHFGADSRSVRPLAGRRALDVGCGAGLLCEPLARLGARATLDPEAVTRHRSSAVPVYLLGQAAGGGEASACAEVLRMSGDAGLDDVLERMARADHPLAQVAEERLASLRGAP